MKLFFKKNIKLLMAFILGVAVTSSIVYATILDSKDVNYDNTKSGIEATNVQDAVDELYDKSQNSKKCPDGYICKENPIVKAYTYNSTSCITGEEESCETTNCYKNKTAGSCPAGTIIKYKVNDSEEKYFHVLHDDGDTITMQQRENTTSNYVWNSDGNSEGPLTILPILENETSGWSNVNDITYTAGTDTLYQNAYTGCIASSTGDKLSCTRNTYTLGKRTAKARMITGQETAALGCRYATEKSCPNWMNNYTYNATSYGGTNNNNWTYGYWTMSAHSNYYDYVWMVIFQGGIQGSPIYKLTNGSFGARAVVEINK